MTKPEQALIRRIAEALERIADLQEELLSRKAAPQAFRTRYKAGTDIVGDLLEQSDAELADIEKRDIERMGAVGAEVTDEEILEGEE